MPEALYIDDYVVADHYVVNILKYRDTEGKPHTLYLHTDERKMDGPVRRVESKEP